MWRRDITEAEVRETLSQSKEHHFFNPNPRNHERQAHVSEHRPDVGGGV